jgi:transglutaminase-like putative cysteine protease
MRLFVNHRTEYRFSEPQRRLIQMLRVTPPSYAGQQIVGWQIDVQCDACLIPGSDGFGNETAMLYVEGPVDQLSLTISGGAPEPLPPLVYLRSTALTKPTPAITELARQVEAAKTDVIARLHRLTSEIYEGMQFDSYQDDADRDAGTAFEEKHGVCQDYAHIFIAAAREMEIPARYVSGHLYRSDVTGAQPAAHAWAEAYIQDLGWVGFDPANDMCPDDAYIRVAVGLDYRDAAPLSGTRRGGGSESLSVSVSVSQAQVQTQN